MSCAESNRLERLVTPFELRSEIEQMSFVTELRKCRLLRKVRPAQAKAVKRATAKRQDKVRSAFKALSSAEIALLLERIAETEDA